MKSKTFLKGQITLIEKKEQPMRFVHGTTFAPGEYLYTEPDTWTVYVEGEDSFEVNKEKIMKNYPERKNVTKRILEELIGKDASILK